MMKNEEKIPVFIEELTVLKEAIDRWGVDAQLRQLQEEAGELIVSINHLCRGRITWNEVCEEMTDVQILINQIRLIENNNDLMNKQHYLKMTRLKERLLKKDKK